ncbi:unnamed protein product (macronuclear) [Paramecium tetraurelia]|uniref:TFIIS central domain-containing protein n=1 Tax=Paramecium tetraurelia TaxID=5888 RepID=A0BUQ7_PARTE|nr:uncharacterized protein GSPATT00005520001 [Paramecium tetraurelia]CAK62274.1 unnamed protein product [Paramecium tetraurelia]|eukprot:XP_001429672.1 hypothetical protein (macronuclear) [Paramecium tetraurelia strain d4-2]
MKQKKGYVMRQQYVLKEFLPALKSCFCGQYVNPDQVLVLCNQCEKAFHVECLINKLDYGVVNCDTCREQISNNVIPEHIKKSLHSRNTNHSDQKYYQNKINERQNYMQIEEEGEEEVELNEGKIDLDKMVKKIKTKEGYLQNQVHVIQQNNICYEDSKKKSIYKEVPTAKITTNETIKQTSQPYKNISNTSIEKMKAWVERYRQMEQNLSNFEKKRQEVREKFFSVIFYGVEELKDMWHKQQNSISQQEKEIITLSDTLLFQFIRNLALDIEVFVHIKLNVQHKGRLESHYVDRCKLIYLHMKDDKNFELRRKVISKEFKAQDLCTRDERELYNPEKKRQFQEIAMSVIELNQKDKDDEEKITKDMEEVSFKENKSINEEVQFSQNMNDLGSSKNSKLMEYSVDRSLSRFKRRVQEELIETERLQILASLELYQLTC